MKKHITTLLAATALVVASLGAVSTSASAGGVLGDIIEGVCGNCGLGRELDEIHRDLGQPLDHIGAAAASAYGVPLSPYCLTARGIAVGPWAPVGIPCTDVNGLQGVIVQY
jgi:hypothetical protein